MSLNLSQLERLVDLNDGGKQARCPACAELGHDRKGEHLRIYADGRFGCCVHPKDREHRKRIFSLAGDSEPKAIRVKVANAKARATIKTDVLGRLGRLFESQNGNTVTTAEHLGTLGTPFSYLRAQAREEDECIHELKEFETGVPSVPEAKPDYPHLLADGTLVIPFSSDDRFHWWKDGQSIAQTRTELLSAHHTGKESDGTPF